MVPASLPAVIDGSVIFPVPQNAGGSVTIKLGVLQMHVGFGIDVSISISQTECTCVAPPEEAVHPQ